ncbi:MAG: peptidoglycan-binding domain-containing protein [Gaiellaceae bacterium]
MRRGEDGEPPEEDWLAEEEDWLEAPTEEVSGPSRPRPTRPSVGAPNRRLIALVGGAAVILIVILLVALQGNGDTEEGTPTAPPAETTPTETETEPALRLRLPADGVLREGDSGARVRQLQRALVSLEYGLTADGVFGPRTTRAVRRFQREAGIDPDGVVGSGTVTALNVALAARE